jgi:hypothetical protein
MVISHRGAHRTWRVAACAAFLAIAGGTPSRGADSLSDLLACREVAESNARLACFDREAAMLAPGAAALRAPSPAVSASAPAAASAGVATHAPQTAVPPNPQQQFGLPAGTVAAQEVAAGRRPAEAVKIEAHVVRFAPGPDGRLVFTLDNDQEWRQLLSEGDLLAKPGDVVTISRGFLGSYWLETSSGRGCKVTRVH